MTKELDDYERRIIDLASKGMKYRAPTIFLTQPTIWAANMTDEALLRLHTGGIGPNSDWCIKKSYYSPRALYSAMQAFNDRLLETCAQHNLICVDLADKFPKEPQYFYDDMHFSEKGTELVSNIVFHAISELSEGGYLDLKRLAAD